MPAPLPAPFTVLEGAWEGEEQLFASPWSAGGTARGSWRFRRDPAGLHLIHDFTEVRASGGRFDGHGVLCADPADGAILWFWFDDHGFPPLPPARGGWDGPALTLEKATPRGLGRTRFTLEDGWLLQTIEARPAGADGFAPVMSGRYRRA